MLAKATLRMRMAAGLTLLYLLVSARAGYEIAAWFIACCMIGYLNGFVVGPSLISLVRKMEVRVRAIVLSVFALACSALLFSLGYGAPLLICTLSFLFIYWMVVLFA